MKNITAPGFCLICKKQHKQSIDLCLACQNQLPWQAKQITCYCCCEPLTLQSVGNNQTLCGSCLTKRPSYQSHISLFQLTPIVRYLVHQLKYHHNLPTADLLAKLMIQHSTQITTLLLMKPTLLLPVPLHPTRLGQRGFNQLLLIGRIIAKHLSLDWAEHALVKTRNTAAQSTLTAKSRMTNLHHAFSITQAIHHNQIIILDDVVTTGATINEITKTILKHYPNSDIHIWSFAKTNNPNIKNKI